MGVGVEGKEGRLPLLLAPPSRHLMPVLVPLGMLPVAGVEEAGAFVAGVEVLVAVEVEVALGVEVVPEAGARAGEGLEAGEEEAIVAVAA